MRWQYLLLMAGMVTCELFAAGRPDFFKVTNSTINDQSGGAIHRTEVLIYGTDAQRIYDVLNVPESRMFREYVSRTVQSADHAASLECEKWFTGDYNCTFEGRVWSSSLKFTDTLAGIATGGMSWTIRGGSSSWLDVLGLPLDSPVDEGFSGPTKTLLTGNKRFILIARKRGNELTFGVLWPGLPTPATEIATTLSDKPDYVTVELSGADAAVLSQVWKAPGTRKWRSDDRRAEFLCDEASANEGPRCFLQLFATDSRDFLDAKLTVQDSALALYHAWNVTADSLGRKVVRTANKSLSIVLNSDGEVDIEVAQSEPGGAN